MSGTNPQVTQGTLNRILTQITLGSYPALNIAAYNMGKSFASITFDDSFVAQIGTATGIVNSPEPYVMSTITVGLLRTQSLSGAWLTQLNTTGVLGTVTGYPDSAVYPPITLNNVSIVGYTPGAYDGTDPVVSITMRGVYYPNNSLWG